jgi:iron complex outermembrane receptor protein
MAAGSVGATGVGFGAAVDWLFGIAAAPVVASTQPDEGEVAELRSLLKADLETLLNTPIDVSSATKTVQKSYEAPAIITTVTRDQIAVWGYRSVAELLGHLLGFFVVDDHVSPVSCE